MAAAEAPVDAAWDAFCSTDDCCSVSENTENSLSLLNISQKVSVYLVQMFTNCYNSHFCNSILILPYKHRKVRDLFNNCVSLIEEIRKQ